MDFDWKKTLPFLGALVTGGVPSLVAAAAGAIGDALGAHVDPTPDAVEQALKAATPEQLAVLKRIDADMEAKRLEAATANHQIDATVEQAYIADTDAARHVHAQTQGVLYLGYLINVMSYLCIFAVLSGCFWLMGKGGVDIDPSVAVMVGGVIGAAVQWLMANAAQANGFFFGSSPGSRQLASDLGRAVGGAVTQAPVKGTNSSMTVGVKQTPSP